MKPVPRLKVEPESLAAYRASNPTDAAASGDEAKAVWDRFRNSEAYSDICRALLNAQFGLCGYCEQSLSDSTGNMLVLDRQIEHVLPKSGGEGRTLDWQNMMLCCVGGTRPHDPDESRRYSGEKNISCGQKKDDEILHEACDPRNFPRMLRMVKIGIDGDISADEEACRRAGIEVEHLNRNIKSILKKAS